MIFTKADLCEDSIHDPDAFARANAAGLGGSASRGSRTTGSTARASPARPRRLIDYDGVESLVPLRVEPRGIVEPFAWLMPLICAGEPKFHE